MDLFLFFYRRELKAFCIGIGLEEFSIEGIGNILK